MASSSDGFQTFAEGVFVGGISGVIAADFADIMWDILDPKVDKLCGDDMKETEKTKWKRIARLGLLIVMGYGVVIFLASRRKRFTLPRTR